MRDWADNTMAGNALPTPASVDVIDISSMADLDPALLRAKTPWLAKGVAQDWPLVLAGQSCTSQALSYLQRFYNGRPVSAFIAEPEIKGRFFYNKTLDGFNFTQVDTTLDRVLEKLLGFQDERDCASLYVGSTNVDAWLPGFRAENDFPLSHLNPIVSLWLGNQSRIAAHFDMPRNLACCALGKRRFTVFPPEQVANLYIGPWDMTPAGQPISLVDTHDPDLARFPRFEAAWSTARVAELEPGDIFYMPSLWWHQVEATADINILINYWWTETPGVLGSPVDAFTHALLSIKSLPAEQKAAWRAFFDHYIFADDPEALAHIPQHRQGRLGAIDNNQARQLRAELTNRLKR